MDIDPLDLIRKVWRHSGVNGTVWLPHIYKIGVKDQEKFHQGKPHHLSSLELPELRDSVDWYWTPAVSGSDLRKVKEYPAQRALWVDCDDSYNDALLQSLRPSFMWETSPGHKQAIWLMREKIAPSEYHRNGLMGMLTQALGADKSGVDIPQLLRVPGTRHHKREEFQGRILLSTGAVYTRGQLLSRVAKGLGFKPGLASELGAKDTYGDRSKVLWRFSRNAAELGLPEDLTFKLLKACDWNKWPDDDDRLRQDVASAYSRQPSEKPKAKINPIEDDEVTEESVAAWDLESVAEFGPVTRQPVSWVVPGIIAEGACGLLVAAPKAGKTRVAIELALGVATGRSPLGLAVRRQRAVGFFSLEDGAYLFASRLSDGINRSQGRQKYHWEGHITKDLHWHPAEPMPLMTRFQAVDLTAEEDKTRLLETILRYDLKLVILDTLSMSIGGAEVSSSKEMNGILKSLRETARQTNCAIMFIHHTRKRQFEKGESIQEMVLGSTALHAWCDFIMNLARPEEGTDVLRLGVQTKMGNDLHYIDHNLKIVKKYEEPTP